MQLLAVEGILTDFDFSVLAQHPIGISLIASLLKLYGFDPLIIFYYLQPFLSAACFVLLYKILITVLPDKFSFFVAFNSMSSIILIKSMNQVTAEIIALTIILVLIIFVWKRMILDQKTNLTSASIMIFISWVAIVFRNASIFVVLGVVFFLFLYKCYRKIDLLLIGVLSIFPGLIKTLFYYPMISHPEKILTWPMLPDFFYQLSKNLLNLTEIILPYSFHLNALPWVKAVIVIIFPLCIFYLISLNKRPSEEKEKAIVLGQFFLIVGICYYSILSFASVYYGHDWGNLHRVSGFGILFFLNAFWIYVYTFARKWKKLVLVALMIISVGKIGFGIRYEIINQDYRFLFQDYRDSIAKLIYHTEGKWDDVFVYTSESWQGRNLYYMLKYYNMVYSLPFNVLEFSKQDNNTPSIIFFTLADINVFQSKGLLYNKLDYLDNVYSLIIK